MKPAQIVKLRASLGWSQNRLASELGLNRSTVCKWESGRHPIPQIAARLLRLLHQPKRSTTRGKTYSKQATQEWKV